ncbi:DUF1796 family putative cysteine peptidase [Cohnella silvisoli]|uniref:DUF1796 family putative cysteine peptidase n=1 Tax=Cohnella silvisoli TaxID=2873699 RepID=A0ABV1L1S9_9BACL|nr:DUF1796 family putative cysteine peptidase [Cohnella silvisoli]MCD9026468.1 papain-like cysteine peptidase [Cohnella silvisoli]
MRLDDLKGEYDATFSLGDLCLSSLQLKKNGLRPFSGVLDWMSSSNLSDVNLLLRNRFIGFFDYENLTVLGMAYEDFICVKDNGYNLVSNHDFRLNDNTISNLSGYSKVMEKYNRRIARFLDKAQTCKKILYVRTEGDFEDVAALQQALSGIVKHDFRILHVIHDNVGGIVELNWPLEKVCAVKLPNAEIWLGNDSLWTAMFEGIQLRDSDSEE